MIRIVKPDEGPAILTSKGRAERSRHEAEFLAERAAFEGGKRRFTFDRTIYGDESVRNMLLSVQHGKCCSHDAAGLADERPLFIDPGFDEPERLIGYREGEPYAKDGNQRAAVTIRELELGRRHLMERRWESFCVAAMMLDILEAAHAGQNLDAAPVEDLAACLAARTRDDAEFASMTRHLIRSRLGDAIRMPLTAAEFLAFARGEALPVEDSAPP